MYRHTRTRKLKPVAAECREGCRLLKQAKRMVAGSSSALPPREPTLNMGIKRKGELLFKYGLAPGISIYSRTMARAMAQGQPWMLPSGGAVARPTRWHS